MLFQACVYNVWKERNTRRHNTGFRTAEQVVRIIDKGDKEQNHLSPFQGGSQVGGFEKTLVRSYTLNHMSSFIIQPCKCS